MTVRNSKHSLLEMPGDLAESRLVSRVSFLNSVMQFRSQVLTDLFRTALGPFKHFVLTHFFEDVFRDLDGANDFFKAKQAQFEKAPHSHPDFLVERVQQKLAPNSLGSDSLRSAFRCWFLIDENETAEVRRALAEWSKQWNLDEDWCRDHALAVVREWLFLPALKWRHIFPDSHDALQRTGWSLALNEIDADATLGHVLVDESVNGRGKAPPTFAFCPPSWDGVAFEVAWNSADETEQNFKKRARVNFRITLGRWEGQRLLSLAENGVKRDSLSISSLDRVLAWRNGILKKFDHELARYIKRIRRRDLQAKTDDGLINACPRLEDNIWKWLVLYQIPQEGHCLSFTGLAKAHGKSEIHIRQSVNKAATLIGLKLRNPHLHAGRPRGSGKPIPHRAHR